MKLTVIQRSIIAELAEHSPIIIQNSSNPSSWKNLDVRPYNCMTVKGATFNMRGQLYHGHANATALFSSPVVSALGSKLDNLGSSPGRDKALCTWDVQEKKMQAPLLGLAIYMLLFIHARSIGKGTYPRKFSDERLMLKTSALKLFKVVNLHLFINSVDTIKLPWLFL